MKNLFAYNIDGSSNKKVGIDLPTWNNSQLNGSEPFVVSEATTVVNYSKINSIENWDKFGLVAGLNVSSLKREIKNYYEANTGTTWSAYTQVEKEILAKNFIVDKPKRDEVFTQQEQDSFNYYKIYDYLSDDAIQNMGGMDRKKTPKSVDYKKDLSQRLHPDYRFDKFGFLTGCTYYENLSVSYDALGFTVFNFSEPIVDYKSVYTFADNGYVSTRTTTRKWYMTDGTLSDDSKVTFKVYPPMVARDEARRRRKNLINNLLVQTVGLFIMTSPDLSNVNEAEADALPLLKDINQALSAYYEFGTKEDAQGNPCELIQEISVHPYSRLDNFVPGTNDTVTIRQFIIAGLDPQ
jgi:hypothetical protein